MLNSRDMKNKIEIVCIAMLQLILFISCDNYYGEYSSIKNADIDKTLQFNPEGDSVILNFGVNRDGWRVSSYATIINNDTMTYRNGLQYDFPVPEGLTNRTLDTIRGDFYTLIKRDLQKETALFIQMDKNNTTYQRNLYIYINRGASGEQLIISQDQQ